MWRTLEKKVWQMWKNDYTLPRMSRELSSITHWSEYLSLCFIVDYLHKRKGIGFSRKQLKYAFSKIPREEVEGARKEAWEWLLHLGGYDYNRGGFRGKNPSLRVAKNTPILSSLKENLPDISISMER
ncbi:hypothetical protein [Candidatus Aciduliprofundum boonei]|uniref:Uncharacterized protein n=1 Tax=Aciduliprofundum boonei (strain DSM 19572 / T469) TaxID=439481 RepID=B5IHL9_ACIB4|nr:hypothetical protein [Candidatus Aciduliprofundum boonei]ADD08808.1 hypothetical protein Aboo_0999 [Aciduliprofundum boonei T469]EDY34234.1 hypothetical protein ABOONEI_2460 [Aciduliprofundum boonei T469]HII55419.1 hypothetical protein [Candidatus Aciduliprofundum boonei]